MTHYLELIANNKKETLYRFLEYSLFKENLTNNYTYENRIISFENKE